MLSPISDYQTVQRDCKLRWNIFNPERYIGNSNNKVVLDIGCAQGWFIEKSLECGAKKAIGIDIADYNWDKDNKTYNGDYRSNIDSIDTNIDIVFLLSVPIDISIIEYIRKKNVETVFFEPYIDSENKSKWKEDEWLDRFRESGFEFYQVGVSDRDRNLYLLRRHGIHMEIDSNGNKIAVKTTVESNEIDFYKKFGNSKYGNYVLPYKLEMKSGKDNEYNLILPWTESTLRLSGDINKNINTKSYLKDIKKAIDWIHYLEIIHGDLRVSNIVIYKDRPYIIDFSWWRYGNIDEDDGIGPLRGKRGYKYIENVVLTGKLRYME